VELKGRTVQNEVQTAALRSVLLAGHGVQKKNKWDMKQGVLKGEVIKEK
jgi:hypothetical protein